MPWCLDCHGVDRLEADHILPAAEFPELVFEAVNLTVRCRTCNAQRGTSYTDGEHQTVMAAIAARRARQAAALHNTA